MTLSDYFRLLMLHDMASSPSPHNTAPIVPATARGEATRRKLLNAAEIEFGHRGFHAASVSSITTRADVGQGTFYLYFHSKEEIFITLVQDIGQALRKTMREAIAEIASRPDAERAGLEAFFVFAYDHPGLYRIVQECQFVDEPTYRDYYEKLAAGYARDLEQAARSGQLSAGDAETRAWALMGIGHFVGMKHCLWEGKLPTTQVLDALMDLVLRGIEPR